MRNFLMLVALLVFATTAWAQEFVETDYVEMPELEPNYTVQSRLGEEIAIAGNQVLASARSASGGQGAVFAFDLTADGQLQFRERLPAQGSTSQFGNQLAADGGFAVVSASGSPTLRFFARSGGTWQQTQQLVLADVPAPPNVFITSIGGELAMSGDLLAIGNHEAHINPGVDQVTTAGAVVLYRRGGNGQWQFETVVISPTPAASAWFGSAVAVAGNTLLVGARGENKAYVFERIDGQWQLARSLQSPDDGGFGWSVAVNDELAVVGRRVAGWPGISNAGSFRAYERNLGGTGQWGFRGEYHSSVATFTDGFSASLALRGRVLLVGAPGTHQAVFFVHRDDAGWEEAVVLDLDDTSHTFNDPNYGAAVAFSGLRAVIGAPNSPGPERWGSVHVWTDISGGGCANPLDGIYCDGFESRL